LIFTSCLFLLSESERTDSSEEFFFLENKEKIEQNIENNNSNYIINIKV